MALQTRRQNLKAVLVLAVLASMLWMGFGPVQLGGPVSYVILSGSSMEPGFAMGDLVLARRQGSYQPGEVVVYRHPKVGFVFHRILAREQNQYILKGDSNDWVDSHQPAQQEILGSFWFSIPGAGNLVRSLRQPAYFTGLSGVMAGLIGWMFLFQKEKPYRKARGRKRLFMNTDNSPAAGDPRQDLLLILGIVAIAALVFGAFAFTRPLKTRVADDVVYLHQADFNYFAPDLSGVYDSASIETGDPVYTSLNCIVDLQLNYRISSQSLSESGAGAWNGSYKVLAKLSDMDGWNRKFLLFPETKFSGAGFEAWTLLDICYLQSLIADKEAKTNSESRVYFLSIFPVINISGVLNKLPFEDIYQPEVNFLLDSTMMRLEGEDSLDLSSAGSIENFREIDNFILIFGRTLEVRTARWIAGVVFGLAILGAIYPAYTLFLEIRKSEASRIQVLSQPLLVDVRAGSLLKKGQTVIEVASFGDLRKLAERYGAAILHEADGRTHRYSVQDQGSLFQFSAEEAVEELDKKAPAGEEKTPSRPKGGSKAKSGAGPGKK